MVKILELFEEEGLAKLKPGVQQPISASGQNAREDLLKAHELQKAVNSARIGSINNWKWDPDRKENLPKTSREIADAQENLKHRTREFEKSTAQFESEVRKAIPFIEQHCSKFIPIFENRKFLYRGFSNRDFQHPVFYGYPRKDRQPVDSSSELQQVFDETLQEMGVKALRSNSIFCTSNKITSVAYGLSYIIIPCNDAKYAWARHDPDLILSDSAEEEHQQAYYKFLQQIYNGDYDNDEELKHKRFQKMFDIATYDIEEAIDQRHEVWVTGHYVAVLANFEPLLRELLYGAANG
jgi:hypothetical protein